MAIITSANLHPDAEKELRHYLAILIENAEASLSLNAWLTKNTPIREWSNPDLWDGRGKRLGQAVGAIHNARRHYETRSKKLLEVK